VTVAGFWLERQEASTTPISNERKGMLNSRTG